MTEKKKKTKMSILYPDVINYNTKILKSFKIFYTYDLSVGMKFYIGSFKNKNPKI